MWFFRASGDGATFVFLDIRKDEYRFFDRNFGHSPAGVKVVAVVYFSGIKVGRLSLGGWCESGARVLIYEPGIYRSKSETAMLIAGCPIFCRFSFFSPS
jgi:hypothetical protein